MPDLHLAAVDLGAQSGRIGIGSFDGQRLSLQIATRFANVPLRLADGLFWDISRLFAEVVAGLGAASQASPLAGVGIDAWGCDYALLDRDLHMLGLPRHHRDERRTAKDVVDRAFERVDQHELYQRTGIQTMPINTLFQLVAEQPHGALAIAERIALIPELLGLWLTGQLVNEVTAASTTGLLEAGSDTWALDLIDRLGVPTGPFEHGLSPPLSELGAVLAMHTRAAGAIGTTVRAVASHDTASAFAAAVRSGPGFAVLSSGTWSLLGVELAEPNLSPDAETFNLSNERGLGGGTRLLSNVMGMWLVEECRREWGLHDAAAFQAVSAGIEIHRSLTALFDPDHGSLLHAGPMSSRIQALCRESGQTPPSEPSDVLRSILVSLACKYRVVIERLESVTGTPIQSVQIVGGGSRNRVLCQLTADVLDREVLAGPQEATAVGNVLSQLHAMGEVSTLAEMRALSSRSFAPQLFTPGWPQAGDLYSRFLEVTGTTARLAGRVATY